MKAIWFFYIGAGIDIIALLVAVIFMIDDSLKGRHATNNPMMFGLSLAMAAQTSSWAFSDKIWLFVKGTPKIISNLTPFVNGMFDLAGAITQTNARRLDNVCRSHPCLSSGETIAGSAPGLSFHPRFHLS